MTYSSIDSSIYGGNPVQLFQFNYQGTDYYYTTNFEDIVYSLVTYTAIPISGMDNVKITTDNSKAPIKIDVDLSNDIAQLFRTASLDGTMTCDIYEGHLDDGDYELIYSGRVMRREVSTRSGKKIATLVIESLITSTARPGLKIRHNPNCPYVVYDSATCKAGKSPAVGTIATISTTTITSTAAGTVTSGKLKGGFIETLYEKRMILTHSGTTITITQSFNNVAVGDACSLHKGCGHTDSACNDDFSNIKNFGGQPFIPSKNPFQGGLT